MKRRKEQWEGEGVTASIEVIINDEPILHDYGLSKLTWHRGVRLMEHFGIDRALELMDQRAHRSLDRGDYEMCCKWRDLMTVIHAVIADEPQPNDRVH